MDYVFEMPEAMLKVPAKNGTVERLEYDTFTYDEGNNVPMKKGAWVYLPYGYSAEKPYHVSLERCPTSVIFITRLTS